MIAAVGEEVQLAAITTTSTPLPNVFGRRKPPTSTSSWGPRTTVWLEGDYLIPNWSEPGSPVASPAAEPSVGEDGEGWLSWLRGSEPEVEPVALVGFPSGFPADETAGGGVAHVAGCGGGFGRTFAGPAAGGAGHGDDDNPGRGPSGKSGEGGDSLGGPTPSLCSRVRCGPG